MPDDGDAQGGLQGGRLLAVRVILGQAGRVGEQGDAGRAPGGGRARDRGRAGRGEGGGVGRGQGVVLVEDGAREAGGLEGGPVQGRDVRDGEVGQGQRGGAALEERSTGNEMRVGLQREREDARMPRRFSPATTIHTPAAPAQTGRCPSGSSSVPAWI